MSDMDSDASFKQEMGPISESNGTIAFEVTVTNTGSVAGKEVVEVYFTPPYNNGGIEKAAVNLVNFAKTDVLAPGASQTIPFTIPKEDMASYDSSAIKTANGGYIRPLQSRRPRRGRGCDARHRGQKRPEAGGHDGQAL